MALIRTLLAGVYTWDGTLTVLTDDTSDVAIGDWIKQNDDKFSPYFKIADLDPGVSVTIENPVSLDIPDGGPNVAYKTEEGIRQEIIEAGDVVETHELQIVTKADTPGSVPVAILGTVTWPGGTADPSTVTTTNTSQLAVGNYMHKTGEADDKQIWKIASINPGVSVDLENPEALTLPGGTGGTKSLARPTKYKFSSPTVQVGNAYHETPTYKNGPDHAAYCEESARAKAIV